VKLSRILIAWTSILIAVVALSGCGSSTSSVVPVISLDTTPPSLPDGLTQVFDPYTSTARLTWNASPSPDVVAYDVYMYQPDPSRESSFDKVGETTADNPSWTLPTSATAQTYSLRVRARDAAGNASAFSPTFTTTVPAYQPAGAGGGSSGDDGYRKRIDS